MKGAFITMCAVLTVSLALCMLSMYVHADRLDEMEYVCNDAIECLNDDDLSGAMMLVDELSSMFDKSSTIMEMLASHNDLHDARNCIVDARVALECEDMDDAYQALVRLQGMIDHLRDHEKLSMENLL